MKTAFTLPSVLVALACLAFTAPAPAGDAPTSPGSTLLFLGGEAVQQELQLTPKQSQKLDTLRADYRRQARAITQANPPGQPAPGTLSKLQTLTGQYDARALDVLTSVQAANLNALQHRTLGAWMITLPTVQDSLSLTADQRGQVGQILEKFDARVDEINRQTFNGEISSARRLDLLKSARQKETRSLERVLTRQQRQTLTNLAQRQPGLPTEGCSR
jgi:Spy/CpxP family protein refolding chaperone